MSDRIYWYIDGRPVQFAGWSADMVAKGGYRDFSGTCAGASALAAQQESELAGFRRNGDPFWYGTLTLDPEITEAGAAISAEGVFKQQFSTKAGRRFFMSRDEKIFKKENSKPYSYTDPGNDIDVDIANGQLQWIIKKGSDIANGDADGWVCWVKDAILTNFSATLTGNNVGAQRVYRVQSAFGPSGARTTEPTPPADVNSAAASIDQALTETSGDLLNLLVRSTSGAAIAASVKGRVHDVEVRGLATASEFTLADCLTILLQLDARSPNIAPSTLDVMPLDFVGTDFDLCVYLTSVADWWFQLLYKDSAGIVGQAGPWETEIQVARRRNARAPLQPLRRYNRVVVPFTTTTDDEQQAIGIADPDPFPGREVTLIIDALEDKQRDGSNFPQDVADLLVARYSKPRRAGTITLSEARGANGKLLSPYEVRAGYLGDIIDHDPALPPQRLDVVKWDGSGVVQVDVEQEGSAIRTLKAASGPKGKPNKKGSSH